MKNFLDIDEKIEQNKEVLSFYYNNYQRTQGKISILALIYSLLAIYIYQIIKYPFEIYYTSPLIKIFAYSFFLIPLLVSFIVSVRYTYLLLKPMDIAFMHEPIFFYNEIRNEYEKELETDDEEVLNIYIKHTYLNELEQAVERNSYLFKIKSKYYNYAFNFGLAAIIFYVFCTGFIIFKDKNPTDINLKNYKEIVSEIDSLNLIN